MPADQIFMDVDITDTLSSEGVICGCQRRSCCPEVRGELWDKVAQESSNLPAMDTDGCPCDMVRHSLEYFRPACGRLCCDDDTLPGSLWDAVCKSPKKSLLFQYCMALIAQ